MVRHSRKLSMILILILVLMIVVFSITHKQHSNSIEKRIVAAVNQYIPDIGECELNLSELFSDFEWDTVSVFVAGNPSQIYDALKIDSDISDGIVFSKDGQPIKWAMSTYQFPKDELPTLTYYVERTMPNDLYYISLTCDDAIVSVNKRTDESGSYKYILYCE